MWNRAMEKVAGLTELDEVVREATASRGGASIFAATSCRLGLGTVTRPAQLNRIPRHGPLIVVANRPTGLAEGFVVPALIDAVRPDMMVLAHCWFARWPALARRMILNDPATDDAGELFRKAAHHLTRGGCLVVFPACEGYRDHPGNARGPEKRWGPFLGRLVRMTGTAVLPVHVSGHSSWRCDLLSSVHPRFGTLWLGRELLGRRGQDIEVRVGRPLPARLLCGLGEPAVVSARCRRAVLDLGGVPAQQSEKLVRIRRLQSPRQAGPPSTERSTVSPEGKSRSASP